MKPRRSRIKLAIVLVALVTLVLLCWRPVRDAWALARLQNSIEGRVTVVRFAGVIDWRMKVPELLERAARMTGFHHRQYEYGDRVLVFLGVPIRDIDISVSGTHGDLGEALSRFPSLERLTVNVELGHTPPAKQEAVVLQISQAVRQLTRLQHFYLVGGDAVTDAAIAPLAGHPSLRELTLIGSVAGHVKETVLALPALERLTIYFQDALAGTSLREADVVELCAGLRRSPHLQGVALGGRIVTDAGIAPLAGHAGIQHVGLLTTSNTGQCAGTLASLPSLGRVSIFPKRSEDLSKEDRETFRKALPSVALDIEP